MKKIISIIAIILLIALSASSCSGKKVCPAYSQVETELPVYA